MRLFSRKVQYKLAWLAALLAAWGAIGHTSGQPPNYDFQWSTITHPGNRPANQIEAPDFYPPFSTPPLLVGSVGYEYRISRTELTTAQWFEFVEAYSPFYTGSRTATAFTSNFIRPTSLNPTEPPGYTVITGFEQVPAEMSWYFAARYVNWLQNGKAMNREAFESGVYDASTFARNPDGTWPTPSARSSNAMFWIPSFSEWVKAGYYDPNRYNDLEDGYWTRPNGTDLALVPGYPEEGGQTSVGIPPPSDGSSPRYLPVGSYPNVQSTWGLYDLSGGVSEWLEDGPGELNLRYSKGSAQFLTFDESITDRLDTGGAGPANLGGAGLRLASAVPSAPAAWCFGIMFLMRRSSR